MRIYSHYCGKKYSPNFIVPGESAPGGEERKYSHHCDTCGGCGDCPIVGKWKKN